MTNSALCHSERSEAESRYRVADHNLRGIPRVRCASLGMTAILGQNAIHDIAPPIHYSLIAPWMIFAASVIVLLLLGALFWYGRKLFRKPQRVLTPRERAEQALSQIERQIDAIAPYQFSIRVSDILRRFVLEQFDLPMTRQTSIEFLNAIAAANRFSPDDKLLLTDFLERCDLIKFARYEATTEDSRRLLDEARRFVKGGTLVTA